MRRAVLLVFLVIGVLALGVFASSGMLVRQQSSPTTAVVVDKPYTTEQEWVVHEVVRRIAAIGAAAGRPSDRRDITLQVRGVGPRTAAWFNEAAYEVTGPVPGGPFRLAIVDHLWSPATYAPVAKALFSTKVDRATDGDLDVSLTGDLTSPSTDTLKQASDRVSARLARNPRSARAHEDAALVLGTLALMERAREFSDVRPALSRMAAHLAIAQALRPSETSDAGRLALAIVFTLVERQADAMRLVADLDRSSSIEVKAWARVLRLRVTGDWRLFVDGPQTTPLERLTYAHAVLMHRGEARFLDVADKLEPRDNPEWNRLAMLAINDVEAGHRWAARGLDVQLVEAQKIWSAFHEGIFTKARLVRDLNDAFESGAPADSDSALTVIDWRTWAGFEQRHLTAHLYTIGRHYFMNLGAHERGESFMENAAEDYGALALYPTVAMQLAQDMAPYQRAMADARELVRRHPESLTATIWVRLRRKPKFATQAEPFPNDVAWLWPHVPTGTAFDTIARSLLVPCERPVTMSQVQRWRELAPFDWWIAWWALWDDAGPKPTMEMMRKTMGPLLEYNVHPLLQAYSDIKGTSAEYLEITRAICRIDDDRCNIVAGMLLFEGRDAEAAEALDRWQAHARNRVSVANGVDWLVSYYEDQQRLDRALEIATDAGDVYSGYGLATMGRLLERRGKHAEAERVFKAIQERYDTSYDLGTYYARIARRTNDPAMREKAAAMLTRWFPRGLESVTPQSFSSPPEDGVVFRSYGRRAERTGLLRDDVIVASEGIRTRTVDQYMFTTQLAFEAEMRFIVWRRGEYKEIRAVVPQRTFGAALDVYRPPAPAER